MNNIIISILAIAVFSLMVFYPETASAEFIALDGAGISGSGLNPNVSYPAGENLIFSGENSPVLSTGVLFDSTDLPPINVNILRTVELARYYRYSLKLV